MIVGAKRFGLDVVDVRIKRADLPAENSEAVFRRMQTERQQRAASLPVPAVVGTPIDGSIGRVAFPNPR